MIDKIFDAQDTFDVAVIGAGMAGIVAARDLSITGQHSVILLEARDRPGGRTYTEKAFDGSIELDMGGAYVHWTQPNVWHELQRHNIPVLPPLEGERYHWLADGKVHSGTETDFYRVAEPLLAQFFADARARFPLPFDINVVDNSDVEKQSLEDRIDSLNLSAYERDVLEGALAGVIHSCREQGAAQLLHAVATYFGNYQAFLETAGVWSIKGGTRSLIDAMLAESTAELCLSTPVRAISDDGDRVTVTTRGGRTIHTRAVVVALPLNTINDVTITPELPAPVRTMIDQKNPVMASKLWVRVKGEIEPFTASAPAGKHPINAARTECRHDGDTLIMCIVSDAAVICAEDREAVQTALRAFVPDIEVVDTACHSWVADEFSKGGWMMHRPGNLTTAVPMIREPHGRIHFAGSDVAAMEPGSIEGAMQSGAVTARNISAALAGGKC